jgi:hypothetical protein
MTIINFSKASPVGWEALSYIWGSSELAGIILINERKMKIAASLETALRHLRDEGKLKVL